MSDIFHLIICTIILNFVHLICFCWLHKRGGKNWNWLVLYFFFGCGMSLNYGNEEQFFEQKLLIRQSKCSLKSPASQIKFPHPKKKTCIFIHHIQLRKSINLKLLPKIYTNQHYSPHHHLCPSSSTYILRWV